ncbi:hypothetical protein ACETWP_17315, partial [Arthrobacter halodurans]
MVNTSPAGLSYRSAPEVPWVLGGAGPPPEPGGADGSAAAADPGVVDPGGGVSAGGGGGGVGVAPGCLADRDEEEDREWGERWWADSLAELRAGVLRAKADAEMA